MDLLDRLLLHDSWTTRQLLLISQDLSDEQLDRDLDIAHRTVRATFVHIIRNVEVWSGLMAGFPTEDLHDIGFQGSSVPELIARLDNAAVVLARSCPFGFSTQWLG